MRKIWKYLWSKKPANTVQIAVDEERPEEEEEESKCDEAPVRQYTKKKLVLVWEMDHGTLVYPTAKFDKRFFTAYALNDRHIRVNGTCVYGPYQVGNKFPMAGSHDVFVTFLPADNLYEATTSYKTIFVEKDIPVLLWTLPSDCIDYGKLLTFDYFKATTQHGDSSIVYSHAVDTALDMGTHVLTATYKPTGLNAINYVDGVAITREITIKGSPTSLTWQDLKGLYSAETTNVYPFTITNEHYKGICLVEYPQLPGVFHYSHPVGSIIDAGITVLKVQFTPTDSVRFLPCSIAREITVVKAAPVLHWPPPIFIYENYCLDDEVLNCVTSTTIVNKLIKTSNTPLPGRFVYTPSHGTIMKELGPVTITCEFIPQDSKNYISSYAEIRTKVMKGKPPLIDWATPDSLVHPQPLTKLELNAKVKGCYPGDFVYDPPIGTILDVGKHELKVTFLSKTVGKTDCFGRTIIEVTVGSPLLTWEKPFDMIEGVPLTEVQLNCRCSNVRNGNFIYDPPKGTRLKKGLKHKLTVTFIPTGKDANNFVSASLTQTINVTYKGKKNPRIEFPTPPGPIRFPAPITLETHLKAVCLDDIPGQFQYFPPPDSILDVGDNFIAVEFTPADNLKWSRIRRSTWITVLPATPRILWKSPPFMNFKEELGAEHYEVKAVLPAKDTNGGVEDEPVMGRFYFDPPIGTILDAGEHILTCHFEPYGKNYIPVQMRNSVMVSRCYPRLEWLPPSASNATFPYYIKQKLHLTAKCVYPIRERKIGELEDRPIPGKFEYSHKDGDLLNAGETTITVLFLPLDSINMYSATASIKLTVAKKTPYILWDKALPDNGSLQYGKRITKAHVSASVVEIEGTFAVNYPVGHVCPHTGEYTLVATFTPSEQYQGNYTTATIERKINITSKRVLIGWVVPPTKGEHDKIGFLDLQNAQLLHEKFGAKILEDNLNAFDKSNLGISADSPEFCGRFEYVFPTKASPNQVVRVTYIPPVVHKDDYYSFSIERVVDVAAVRPALTWSISLKDRTIPYGLPISRENILKCQCRLYEGTVVYENGVVGSTPALGRYKVHARFVPSYAQYQNNVLIAKSSIGFTVSKATPKIIWEPAKYVPYGYVLSAKDFAARAVAPYIEDEDEGGDDSDDDDSNDDDDDDDDEPNVVVSDVMRTMLEKVCIDEEIPCRRKEKVVKPVGIFEKCVPALGTVLTTKRNVLTMQFTPQGTTAYCYRKVTLIREIYIDDKK